jgi:hypothetical protein
MKLANNNGLLRILAVLAMLLFMGDLVADSVAEICEMRCAAESSQSTPCDEKGPCQCICATHIGAVIATDFAMHLGSDLQPESFLPGADAVTPPRLAVSIDHPPQLS